MAPYIEQVNNKNLHNNYKGKWLQLNFQFLKFKNFERSREKVIFLHINKIRNYIERP